MKKQSGFSILALMMLFAVIALVAFAVYKVTRNNSNASSNTTTSSQKLTESKDLSNAQTNGATCDSEPTIKLPVDNIRIKAVLYPGQVRGGNFKPHGGFLLTGSNDANVTLPIAGKIIDGVRYYEGGEIQYMFDFEADCGYRFRLDHLHTLTQEMQKFADQLPQPTEDSRTTNITSSRFEAGTIIATKVGFLKTSNTSFDFGFYNMNIINDASQQADWPKDFQYQTELATHGTCWFDFLSSNDEDFIRGLPAGDGQQGKNSKYCK